MGVPDILEAIIQYIPAPPDNRSQELRALILIAGSMPTKELLFCSYF